MWIYEDDKNCYLIKEVNINNNKFYKIKVNQNDWLFSRKEFNKLKHKKIITWKENIYEK